MTCGPYRPITLTTYSTRIQDFHPRTSTSPFIALKVDIELDGNPSADVKSVLVTLKSADGEVVRSEKCACNLKPEPHYVKLDSVVSWDDLQERGVGLWWPFSYGKQVLYDVEVSILDSVSGYYSLVQLLFMSSIRMMKSWTVTRGELAFGQ